MAQRVRFIVTCTLVMDCADGEHCHLAECRMLQRGFQSRGVSQHRSHCVRSLEREYTGGSVGQHLQAACLDVESATVANVVSWKAYVQVVGNESAWATLEAGKPTLRGVVARGRAGN